MIVFKQTRELLFGCGVIVDKYPTAMQKLSSVFQSILLIASNTLYLMASIFFVIMYYNSIDGFQVVYCILEAQWTLISMLLLFVLFSIRKETKRMVIHLQEIVNESEYIFVVRFLPKYKTVITEKNENLKTFVGSTGEAEKFYIEAERRLYVMSKWPNFILQSSYMFVQTSTCLAYLILDMIHGHFDPRQYYFMTII